MDLFLFSYIQTSHLEIVQGYFINVFPITVVFLFFPLLNYIHQNFQKQTKHCETDNQNYCFQWFPVKHFGVDKVIMYSVVLCTVIPCWEQVGTMPAFWLTICKGLNHVTSKQKQLKANSSSIPLSCHENLKNTS